MPPIMPGLKNGIPPPRPYTDWTVTVDPIGNCVCGLKEPLVLCADTSGVVATSPVKAKSSRIPVMVDLVIFCINFTSSKLRRVVIYNQDSSSVYTRNHIHRSEAKVSSYLYLLDGTLP